ncbi:DUF1036 domain-containing protein [Sandarakinorhabdus sp.]|uniref:DUF1036 domain-containing protein n=1 Tax=Sandarakinorhabdus sp. TaxID=1916663 RepID=UPI00286E562F|nr:DUF1036 domain-containing protein [Sandarakinorhabdus sp.]
MKTATLFFAIIWLFMSAPAQAGLFFCNNSAQTVAVAVGWKENDRWVAAGWRVIESTKCDAALLGALNGAAAYYYYGEVVNSNMKYESSEGEPGAKFCIRRSAFKEYDVPNCFNSARFRKINTNGLQQYTVTLIEKEFDAKAAATECAAVRFDGNERFVECWIKKMSTERQKRIIDCISSTRSKASLALCAYDDQLDSSAYKAATCAANYSSEKNIENFLSCAAGVGLSDSHRIALRCALSERKHDRFEAGSCLDFIEIDPEARRLYRCVLQNGGSYRQAGLCIGRTYLSKDQQIVTKCVLDNIGRYSQMAVCAVGNNLTPEQQAFASCAVNTGGQPVQFAACFATQLTVNELEKCVSDGIGGSGCFGNNNTIVKFVNDAWRDVTEGPGPSNDLLGRDGFIGRTAQNIANDFTYGPGASNDFVGADGFVCKALFGGC